jgi:hypothetical protein
MRGLNQRIGRGLLLVAFLLLTAILIHPFTLGGQVWGGKVENGRYFVVSAGHRYTEVSEARWRIEQQLECCFPWLPVVLIWMGLAFRDGPGVPSKLTAFLGIAGVVGTASVVAAGWLITDDPWTPVLIAWLVVWGGCFVLAWWQSLSARSQSSAEPGAAPDPARDAGF